MGMLYRIVIEAEGQDPQGLKEDLASALERYGPARVVAVEPKERWRQEGMFDRGPPAQYAGGCGHPPLRKTEAPRKGLGGKPPSLPARIPPHPPAKPAPSPQGESFSGNPWERADRAWDGVMKGLEHG